MATRKSANSSQNTPNTAPIARVFPDGYDLDAEKSAVQHLLDQDDPNPADQHYERYETYLNRLGAWDKLQEERAARGNAEVSVPLSEAAKMRELGALLVKTEDTITLHTADAVRLYMGVDYNEATKTYGVPGAWRAASGLRQLFFLTSNDNPFAEWVLVTSYRQIEDAKVFVNNVRKDHLAMMEDARSRGKGMAVLESASPQVISLGYSTPYTHALADLILAVDLCVRTVRSCQRRDLVSGDDAAASLLKIKKDCRSLFTDLRRSSEILSSFTLRSLSRADFYPDADALAKQRVESATKKFGAIPAEILTLKVRPRHALGYYRMNPVAKAQLLAAISEAKQEDAAAEAQAPGAVTTDLV